MRINDVYKLHTVIWRQICLPPYYSVDITLCRRKLNPYFISSDFLSMCQCPLIPSSNDKFDLPKLILFYMWPSPPPHWKSYFLKFQNVFSLLQISTCICPKEWCTNCDIAVDLSHRILYFLWFSFPCASGPHPPPGYKTDCPKVVLESWLYNIQWMSHQAILYILFIAAT